MVVYIQRDNPADAVRCRLGRARGLAGFEANVSRARHVAEIRMNKHLYSVWGLFGESVPFERGHNAHGYR